MATATARARKLPSLGGERLREAMVGYGFVLVPLGVFALFYVYPMVYAFYVSAHEWGGIEGNLGYVGLENYGCSWTTLRSGPGRPERGTAMWNTFYYALLVVPLQMAVGLTMAVGRQRMASGAAPSSARRTTFRP